MGVSMRQMRSLLEGFRLTTVEIIYHMPDHPDVLQSFIWQDYDLPPNYPKLKYFLEFWSKNLDGKLHSVYVVSAASLALPEYRLTEFDEKIH
jgi:uncharacterized protein Usg